MDCSTLHSMAQAAWPAQAPCETHLAGAALDDQKAVLAHCACLLGVCQGCTSVSALEMHIMSVIVVVTHCSLYSTLSLPIPVFCLGVYRSGASIRRLMNGFLRAQDQYGGVLLIWVLSGGGRTAIWEKSGMQVA